MSALCGPRHRQRAWSRSTGRKCRSWTAAPLAFVEAIDQAGIAAARRAAPLYQGAEAGPRRERQRLRRASPHDRGFRLEVEIDFADPGDRPPAQGDRSRRRRRSAAKSPGPAPSASCRTSRSSGRPASRSARRSRTPSRSARQPIINPEGLRFADEFVRHKMLDAVGDLALAGAPILGAYRSYCGGHRLNCRRACRRLFVRPLATTRSSRPDAPRDRPCGDRTARQRAGFRALDALTGIQSVAYTAAAGTAAAAEPAARARICVMVRVHDSAAG